MVYRKDYRRGRRARRRKGLFASWSLTNVLILINVVLFVLFYLGGALLVSLGTISSLEDVLAYVAINPELFFSGYVWTLITSMFMHGSFGHLLVNMVSLFFIGNFVEKVIGRKRYFWFYMISGIIAGLAFVSLAYFGLFFVWGDSVFGGISDFAVGASGALFGLGGLLAVLIPKLRVLVFFIIPMPLWLAMVILMFGLWIFSVAGGLPVGNTAHFGGLVVGVIYGFYLRSKYSKKISMLNKMFR